MRHGQGDQAVARGRGCGREPGRDARGDAHGAHQDGELRALLPRRGRARVRRGRGRGDPVASRAFGQAGDQPARRSDVVAHLRCAPRALRRRAGPRVGAGGRGHRHRLRGQRVHRVGRARGQGRAQTAGAHALRAGRELGPARRIRRLAERRSHGARLRQPRDGRLAPDAQRPVVQALGVPEGAQEHGGEPGPRERQGRE